MCAQVGRSLNWVRFYIRVPYKIGDLGSDPYLEKYPGTRRRSLGVVAVLVDPVVSRFGV